MKGLVVHYTFDNAGNRDEDSSGNDRHGTMPGSGNYATRKIGTAVRLALRG